MPKKIETREYRPMNMEIRQPVEGEPEAMIVEGYACTFNQPYELWRDSGVIVSEQIDARAFDNCNMDDVIMQYNHEGRVFARRSNGTLTVEPNEKGLYTVADLGGTTLGRGLYEEIAGGYTNKMSFGFTVTEDEYAEEIDENDVYHVLRTVKAIGRLYDVSAVSIPANENTSIGAEVRQDDATSESVRNLVNGVIDKVETERMKKRALETKRRQIKTRAKAVSIFRGSNND